jgi:UDP-N-acetylglucosamine:LPS N-acetylglucosamine transferase
MVRRMTTIDFVFFDAGGGHRSAANALKLVIESQQRPWEVRLVNLQELLEPLDFIKRFTGLRIEDAYNEVLLRQGWTLGAAKVLKLLHFVIRQRHGRILRRLTEVWQERRPDLVVSLIPNFNRVLLESVNAALPGVPFVTVITDMADYPPHFWLEPQEQYVVCGSGRAVEQARAMGFEEHQICATSGMVLHPRFYEKVEASREDRNRLGLDPERLTGLLLFGGQGSREMLKIARELDRFHPNLQLILICGRNEALRKQLEGEPLRMNRFIEGFTREVPFYMQISDFLIGKPGPGSISEAVQMKLPVVVECNRWTLPQERYNAAWVKEKGAGIVLGSFREIGTAVEQLLQPGVLDRLRSNAAAIQNRAVFEIPDFFERVLQQKRENQEGQR